MDSSILSNEQLAGQRLMVGFDGTRLDDALMHLIDGFKVGGIILFSRNLETPAQIRDLCRSAQQHALDCAQPPLLIAIDQEGGTVARLKAPFTRFAGNAAMRSEQEARDFARITAGELAGIGVNMNRAPVMDVVPSDGESVMRDRSFGHDPDWVSRLGVRVIEGLQQRGIMAVAKHFPGIGNTTLDSHLALPTVTTDLPALAARDLLPFEAAIAHNVAGIMLSHILYPQLDPQWPASLSPPIVGTLLRERLGYGGVVMTDDLDMGAIVRHHDIRTAISQVLAADVDMALICRNSPKVAAAVETIRTALAVDPALQKRGCASVDRILALKRKYPPPRAATV
jgi:beta-N-acetylhexosaminidase